MKATTTAWAIRIRAADGSGERLAGRYEVMDYGWGSNGPRAATFTTRALARLYAKDLRSKGIHATPVKVSVEIKEV